MPFFTGIDSPYEAPEAPEVRHRRSGRLRPQGAGVVVRGNAGHSPAMRHSLTDI